MINLTPEKKEKMLAPFYLLQTQTITFKNNQKAAGTKATKLTPDMFKLIGVYMLMPGKLDHLLALTAFMQEQDGFGSDELIGINETLIKASTMANAKQQTIDNIYNTSFTSIIKLIGNHKEALLREAAIAGNELAVVQLLKIVGIDVNAKNFTDMTALVYAAQCGHTSIVTQLLNAKDIAVNASDDLGWTALMCAALKGYTSVVTQLLNAKDIAVNAKGISGMTALMYACRNGHTSVVTQLLNAKDIAVNAISDSYITALMDAAYYGRSSVVRELLKVNGILVNAKNIFGWTALMLASSKWHTSIAHQLCIKQLFDAPFDQAKKLFQQLTNEIKSAKENMTINPASLCAYFIESVEALPTADKKITLLEKALSKSNAFSALMQNEHISQIQSTLDALKNPLVLFSTASTSSSSNPSIGLSAPVRPLPGYMKNSYPTN